MEVVASISHANVVVLLYGCEKLDLGSSLLHFEWVVTIFSLKLPFC
jgi:hypothetical protein